MYRRFEALETISRMCSFHLRVSLIVTPRTLCEETRSKGRSLTHKGPRSGRVLSELITSSLHFFGLRFILFRDDHCAMTSSSF